MPWPIAVTPFQRFHIDYILFKKSKIFVAAETEVFFSKNGIKHVTIPSYKNQSNGAAENSVKTLKNKISAGLNDYKNSNTDINTIIL